MPNTKKNKANDLNDSELAQEMEKSQNKLVSDANIKILSVVAPPVLYSRKKSLRSSSLSITNNHHFIISNNRQY